MAKKVKSIQSIKAVTPETALEVPPSSTPALPKLPPELEKKLQALKEKLDSFKAKVLDKFADYIVGIALLPPEQPPKQEGPEPLPGEERVEKAEKDKPEKADKEKKNRKSMCSSSWMIPPRKR